MSILEKAELTPRILSKVIVVPKPPRRREVLSARGRQLKIIALHKEISEFVRRTLEGQKHLPDREFAVLTDKIIYGNHSQLRKALGTEFRRQKYDKFLTTIEEQLSLKKRIARRVLNLVYPKWISIQNPNRIDLLEEFIRQTGEKGKDEIITQVAKLLDDERKQFREQKEEMNKLIPRQPNGTIPEKPA